MYKACCKCHLEKSLSSYSNDKSRKDGKNPRCKSCDSVYFSNRSQETRLKEKERVSSGRYDNYYSEYRIKNRDKKRVADKLWRQSNKDKRRASEALREARKLKATPPWLSKNHLEEIKFIYAQARDCQVVTGEIYHVDHIVPLQGKNVCGLHVPWNLQVLPAEVNIRKNNRYEET